jgi:diguanylate cyclase (GGDEF)-like protein
MRSEPHPRRRWRFSVSVIAPTVILLVVTALAVAAFVFWTTRGIDERSLQRQRQLVSRAIERQIAEIPYAQESIAIWDDAVQYAKLAPDKEWLDNNLGTWMIEYYGFDAVAVISDADAPVYTATGESSPSPEFFIDNWAVFEPLIAELRAEVAGGALDRYAEGTQTELPRVLDIKPIAGTPAVVSILPIVSQTGGIQQAPGTEHLHIAVDYLDQDFADKLHANYLFDDAGFVTGALPTESHASYPVLDRAGRVAAVFEWQPSRPGLVMLNQTAPVLALSFLIAAVVVYFLLRRLWRSSAALEEQRASAEYEALHDPLTGLANRTRFEQRLELALREKQRLGTSVGLLLLDLDRFKHVNDTLGHTAGDDLIRAVGQRLTGLAGEDAELSRLGGDEFAVVYYGDATGAQTLADNIVEAVAKPFEVSGSEAFVGASVGLAIAGPHERNQRELIRRADIALYEAKAGGRGRAVTYSQGMDEKLQDRHMIEAELREALKSAGQLSVAFQPLFSGRTGDIVGAEALVRWTHPKLGPISPARFIPIAEGAGLIEPVGEFVLRRSLHFGARWPGRRVAVNLSPVQLMNPNFPERLLDLLIETGMRPSDLELEITEGILLDRQSTAVETLTALRNAGIRIALDDFGTGYSSLSYLKHYPVDCIKIDRSFVAQLGASSTSVAIVNAMVALAHALGIEVTAEGVETNEQMTILTDMGCNLFQGFLLSPPTTEQEVESEYRRGSERPGVADVA